MGQSKIDCTNKQHVLCPLLSIISFKEREPKKRKVSMTSKSKEEGTNADEQPSEYAESKFRDEVGLSSGRATTSGDFFQTAYLQNRTGKPSYLILMPVGSTTPTRWWWLHLHRSYQARAQH